MPIIIPNRRSTEIDKPPVGSIVDCCSPFSRNLQLCYLFNEAQGFKCKDLAYDRYSVFKNISTSWDKNRYGQGVRFNGTSGGINVTPENSMALRTRPLTIGVRFNAVGFGENSEGRIIQRFQTTLGVRGACLFVDNVSTAERISFKVRGVIGTLARNSANNTISLSTDYIFFLTWTGSELESDVRFFLNGSEMTYGAGTDADDIGDSTGIITIGQWDLDSRTFNGVISWLYVWNRVLSVKEVVSLTKDPFQFIRYGKRKYVYFSPAVVGAKTASTTKSLISITANNLTCSKSVVKTATLTKTFITIQANNLSVDKGIQSKTATTTKANIQIISNTLTASKGQNKTASTTKSTVSIVLNNVSCTKSVIKTATSTKVFISLVTNNLTATKVVTKTATSTNILITIKLNSPSCSIGPTEAALLGVIIYRRSRMQTVNRFASRIDTYLQDDSRMQTTILEKSAIWPKNT